MSGETYFDRHWNGELSLAKSYWINHLFIGGIAYRLLAAGVAAIKQGMGEQPLACMGFIGSALVLWLGIQIWQIGGTWRAAARAKSEGRSRIWSRLVQSELVTSVLGTIGVIGLTLLPLTRAAMTGAPLPVVGAIAREGGRVVDFYGPITNRSAAQFRQVLGQANPVLVRLESGGGRVVQARAMAAMIRSRGLNTAVSGRCISACTILFFAGRNRWLVGNGVLGFHSYSSMQVTPQRLLAEEGSERRVFLAGGVARAFVDRIFSIPPARVWFPTRAEVEAAQFATRHPPDFDPNRLF